MKVHYDEENFTIYQGIEILCSFDTKDILNNKEEMLALADWINQVIQDNDNKGVNNVA